jgi:hypothetical protein
MTDHKSLPVLGYRAQDTKAIDRVNSHKQLEERCLRALDSMQGDPAFDQRWLAIGRTQMELAWMAVNRAVFKPERAVLDGDEDDAA